MRLCMMWLLLLYAISCQLYARQTKIDCNIYGQVITAGNRPVPYASLSLIAVPAGTQIQNSSADSLGRYCFTGIAPGNYILHTTAVGFALRSDSIRYEAKNSLYTIFLTPAKQTLQEVVINSSKQLMRIDQGRIVMNVQGSSTGAGSNAWELLKKMPGISVGSDDNIMLRGNAGINVLIDGKMSYLSGKQLANLLQGIAGDNISKIELITAPSAEYDAAGNGGIINIVTNRQRKKGYTLDLKSSISTGRYWMTNQTISAGLNTASWNAYVLFDYNTPHSYTKSRSGNSGISNNDSLQLQRNNSTIYKIRYYTYRAGLEWQPSRQHRLGVHYHGYYDDFLASKYSILQQSHTNGAPPSTLQTSTLIDEPYYYEALHFHYQYEWDSSKNKLSFDAHGINYRNYSDGTMTSTSLLPDGSPARDTEQLLSHQPGFIRIRTAKADLQKLLGHFTLKAGLKYAFVSNDNNYQFDSVRQGIRREVLNMSDHFKYTEKVSALYTSLSRDWHKTTITAGLRLEYTDATGLTVKTGSKNDWNYLRVFPNLSIDQQINSSNKLNISISRRINRPAYTDLNPVRWYNDPQFYYTGNPHLIPEMAWIVSASNSFRSRYILTASYTRRNHYMTKLLRRDSSTGAISSLTANFSDMDRADLLLSASVTITAKWSAQLTTGVNYSRYPVQEKSGQQFLRQWAATLTVLQQFKLPWQIQADLNTYLFSNELWGVYRRYGTVFTDLGLKKNFLRRQLDLVINCSDVFNSNRFKGKSLAAETDYRYYDKRDTRRLTFSVRYHFGRKDTDRRPNRTEELDRL